MDLGIEHLLADNIILAHLCIDKRSLSGLLDDEVRLLNWLGAQSLRGIPLLSICSFTLQMRFVDSPYPNSMHMSYYLS
jgi:hypothetical protein